MYNLTDESFDCPNCGIKNSTYIEESSLREEVRNNETSHFFNHLIIRCNNVKCNRLTYFIEEIGHRTDGDTFIKTSPYIHIFGYPSLNNELPEYIPEKIRRYYKEANLSLGFGLINAASAMCRRVIYELCDKLEAKGEDYKEKINNLGFDKRITDPLISIKNIGDETIHANPWDEETVTKALDAAGIIINMAYIQEERIKDFQKHYTKTNQIRSKS